MAQDSRDIPNGSIWIIDVPEGDSVLGFKGVERLLIGKVAAFAVCDGQVQELALVELRSEWRVRGLGAQGDFAADEFEILIAQQRSGEDTGFHQNLESVADAENETACRRELFHGAHDRREARNRAAAEIVAVGKSAGKKDCVDVAEIGGIVPDEIGFAVQITAQILVNRVPRIVVAIAAGEDDDANFHAGNF